MGAVYYVRAELDYPDEAALIDAMNDYIDENDGNGMRFGFTSSDGRVYDRGDISDLMKIFITDRGYEEPEPGVFTSSFDASYGWEMVMTGMFEFIAPYLADGSCLEVYPDSGRDLLEVRDGQAVWIE